LKLFLIKNEATPSCSFRRIEKQFFLWNLPQTEKPFCSFPVTFSQFFGTTNEIRQPNQPKLFSNELLHPIAP